MPEMIERTEAYNMFGKKGTANTALGLGIAGTALGVLNGGLGNILGNIGGGNATASAAYSCRQEDDRFVNKDVFWRQNLDIQKEFGRQEYEALKSNYDLYITLDNKISALAINQAKADATLPLAFKISQLESNSYTDAAAKAIDKQLCLGLMAVEGQLAKKVDGQLGLPWSSIISGIPTIPNCTLDVSCGG